MEYVGRRVKKEFQGRGMFFGLIQAYEPATGIFKIAYDDGDSEELEFSEVASLLASAEPLPPPLPLPSPQPPESSLRKPGRKQKKRRRIINNGKDDDNSVINSDICCNLVDIRGDSGELDLNLNEGLDLNDDGFNYLSDDVHGGNEVYGVAKLHGLDLNQGVNVDLHVGLDLNDGVVEKSLGAKKEMIDLNLDVNEDFENLCGEKKGRSFDLNLQFTEDDVGNLDDCMGQSGAHETVCAEGCSQIGKKLASNENLGVLVNVDGEMGNADLYKGNKDEILRSCTNGIDNRNASPVSAPMKRRGRKRKDSLGNKSEFATPETVKVEGETGNLKLELLNRDET